MQKTILSCAFFFRCAAAHTLCGSHAQGWHAAERRERQRAAHRWANSRKCWMRWRLAGGREKNSARRLEHRSHSLLSSIASASRNAATYRRESRYGAGMAGVLRGRGGGMREDTVAG
jgi:hypothetical protein